MTFGEKGPRQIGKTESIKIFAEENYKSVIEINFVTSEKYKQITADGYSAESVIKSISLIDPSHKSIPGETFIPERARQRRQRFLLQRFCLLVHRRLQVRRPHASFKQPVSDFHLCKEQGHRAWR